MQDNKNKRWLSLDGIRGLAILSIIAYHVSPHRFSAGFLGVDAFLFLSGYLTLLGLKKQEAQSKGLAFGKLVKKRVRKVWRPMAILFIGILAYLFLFIPDFLFNSRANVVTSLLFVSNYYQIHHGVSYFSQFLTPNVFTHLWYLALYMQLTLIFPLLVHLLYQLVKDRSYHRWIYLALAILSALLMGIKFHPGADPTRVYYGADTRAFSFLLGAFLAEIWDYNSELDERLKAKSKFFPFISLVTALAILYLSINLTDASAVTYRFGMWFFDLLLMGFVLSLSQDNQLTNRLLRTRPLQYFASRSLYLYLWYYPILLIYEKKMGALEWPAFWHITCQCLFIVVLAELAYRLDRRKVIVIFSKRFWKKVYQLVNKSFKQGHFYAAETLAVLLILSIPSLALAGFLTAKSGQDPRALAFEQELKEQKKDLDKLKQNASRRVVSNKVKSKAKQDAFEDSGKSKDQARTSKSSKKSHKDQSTPINHVKGLSRHEQLVTSQLDITFYGDSVLLASQEPLLTIFPKATINGKVGRQLYQSIDDVKWLADQQKLGDVVVFLLGTNGGFSDDQLDQLIKNVGKRPVFLVNVSEDRSWESEVNHSLYKASKRYKNVYLVNWKKIATEHPEYFREDLVHPTEEGSKKLAIEIAKQITQVLDKKDQGHKKNKDKKTTKKSNTSSKKSSKKKSSLSIKPAN